jgi:hypothetical protein
MSTRRPTTRARADDGFARDDDEDDGAHDDVAANTIVVYTKPGCCLCDGLKDKLDAAVDAAARAPPGASLECLRDFALCVRDVSTNAAVGGIIRWKRPESVRARRRRRGFHRTLERRLARVRAPAAQARRRARRRRLGLARSPRVARARARGMDGRHHHRLGRAFVVVLARICKSM